MKKNKTSGKYLNKLIQQTQIPKSPAKMAVRRAPIRERTLGGGAVTVRTLAGETGEDGCGAQTFSPMTIAHVELRGSGASHTVPLPEGWTCFVYCRRGPVEFPAELGGGGAPSREPSVAQTHDTVYFGREGGECLRLCNAHDGLSDVMVFAGAPLLEPVVASGTMVMNSERDVQTALADFQRGDFGVPWDHKVTDEEWVAKVDADAARRAARSPRTATSAPPTADRLFPE